MLAIVLLPVMAVGVLRIGPVQDYMAQKAAEYFSDELKAEVSVEDLKLTFGGNIVLGGFDINDRENKDLASFEEFKLDLNRFSIKKKRINLGLLKLSGAKLNYTRIDSTQSNIDFLLEYFAGGEESTAEPFSIYCDRIIVDNTDLQYKDYSVGNDSAHYQVNNFRFDASRFASSSDSTGLQVDKVKFDSPGLFDVKSLKVTAGVSGEWISLDNFEMQTDRSAMNFNIRLNYDSLAQLNKPFTHNIRLNASFKESFIIPDEFKSLLPKLQGLEDTVFVQGAIQGLLRKPVLNNFKLRAMPYASFNGQGNIQNVDSLSHSFMEFNVQEAFMDPVASEKIIKRFAGNDFSLPRQVKNLGRIRAKGKFRGKLDDFYADAVFSTAAGDIVTDVDVWKNKADKIAYKGKVTARNFNLARVMNDNTFGYVGLEAVLDGAGLDKYASANLDIKIDSISINNRQYNNLKIKGGYDKLIFDGIINVQTPRLKLVANGKADFSDTLPRYIASIKIPHANLKSMGVVDKDFEGRPVISTSLMMHLTGDNADNLEGWLRANDTQWADHDQQVLMEKLRLKLEGDGQGYHQISMTSDYADARIDGVFSFAEMQKDIQYLLAGELPQLVAPGKKEKPQESQSRKNRYLNFRVELKETKPLTDAFAPQLRVAPESYIAGTMIPQKQKLDIEGKAYYMLLGGLKIRNVKIDEPAESKLGLHLYADRIELDDTIGIDRFNFKTWASNDSMQFNVFWDDYSNADLNKGDISGALCLHDYPKYQLHFDKSYFTTNDTLWRIEGERLVSFDSSSVKVDQISIGSQHQSMKIDGKISRDSADGITVMFDKLNISNIDPFTHNKKLDFDGKITGDFKVKNLYSNHPTFTSDLTIDSIGFNHQHLGDAIIQSGWVDTARALKAGVEIRYQGNIGVSYPLKVEGLYYPYRDDNNFNFDLTLDKFKMQTIAGYLKSFTSYFRGYASGEMKFRGDLVDPELVGQVRLIRTVMKIDYLNTTYSFTDTVKFRNNEILFSNVTINDNNAVATRGNKAFLNGKIGHENFKNIRLDLSIDAEDFTMLNTSYADNEMYYGTAITSGKINIYGPTHDVQLDAVARAEKGSKLFIPLSGTAEASQTDYISFINNKDTVKQVDFEQERRQNVQGLGMDFDLEISPEAEVQIIFDEQVGDIIKARGSGDLELNIDTRGEFSMYGNYQIQEGDYLFTLQNIINKRFAIEEGSSIRWSGDPYDASIDLDAIYKTEARLYDLVSYLDSSDIYKKRRPVNCVLHLTGDLMSPEVTPGIKLPNADEITRQLLKSTLYVNANQVNRQEMNRQFVGLLILGSFFPPANMAGAAGGSVSDYAGLGGATSSTELLSNQLSNWLSQISDDFNIGVNYRPGDEISNEEVEVALSTQLFNDKVSISTNVGVGGEKNSQQTVNEEETSNIVGDVNVEYKWTDKLRIRAFNQHNSSSYLEESGPYTQGVGVFFRREFDSFRELFQKNKKKQKPQNESE